MLVDFGKAGYLKKARQQPEKVRQVLDKIRADGLFATIESVRRKLDEPIGLGYCNAGVVIGVGSGVSGYAVGDRVVSNGRHAEVVSVPANLCARIPAGVSDEGAAFTVLGSIALQGIRLVQPTLGEAVVVMGLGLIGQIAVQLLRAHGCRVLGLDFDQAKLELARAAGAEIVDLSNGSDPVQAALAFSRGRGVDAVLVTASTSSSEPMHQAALMSRKRGRIVLVGVTGLELSRADFYEKELTFQVSCSYGPGRYDPGYEEGGADYPIGFVRWTEQRNLEAILDMLADGRLDVSRLISHRFDLIDIGPAYGLVSGGEQVLGIVLNYPAPQGLEGPAPSSTLRLPQAVAPKEGALKVGFVGAGNYAAGILIPAFRKAGAFLQSVSSSGGVSAVMATRKNGFVEATTDAASLVGSALVDAVVVATRHDSHAHWTALALRQGKHVFVEKPLALDATGLRQIEEAREAAMAANGREPVVMVGFNRRFSPFIKKMQGLLAGVTGPKACIITINAGSIPGSHWTQDPAVGGGRIIGEACHFIDLARCLIGAPITGWYAEKLGTGGDAFPSDRVTFTLKFADGSMATVHYLGIGHRGFPKERVEVFADGRVLQLDNFRVLRGWGWPGFSKLSRWRQDKGQLDCAAAFIAAAMGETPPPIPWDELLEVSRVTIGVADTLR
jgi:predicted dehydrogenase/threonine dehydrogenase-like Zn-dependent dehydrogenase